MKPLQSRIRAVRNRLLAIALTTATLVTPVCILVMLVVAVWLDLLWDLSAAGRIMTVGIAMAAGLIPAVIAYVFIRRRIDLTALASRLDKSADAGGAIVAGNDLIFAMKKGERMGTSDSPTTRSMAEVAISCAAEIANSADVRRTVSARPIRNAFITLLGVVALLSVSAAAMPRLAKTEWDRFTSPSDDQPPFSLIKFKVEPGDVDVLYGDDLEIVATLDGPAVDRPVLVLIRESEVTELPMFAEGNGRYRVVLTQLTEAAEYHVASGRARSLRFDLNLITTPRIVDVQMRVVPPSYTNLAPIEGEPPDEGISGLPTSKVELTVKSNRPLSGGQLTYRQTVGVTNSAQVANASTAIVPQGESSLHELTPDAKDPTRVTGYFAITKTGRVDVRLFDVDGTPSRQPLSIAITQLEDERPMIRIIQPQRISLATPTARIPVKTAAEDDYGVKMTSLYRSLNRSRPMPHDFDQRTPALCVDTQTATLPLADYGLEPGDEIRLFARAIDTDPAGPKGSESNIVTIQVISQEEFEQMAIKREGLEVLLSKYREARRQLESLARKMKESKGKEKDLDKELEELAEAFRKESKALKRLAENTMPIDIDKQLSPKLLKQAEMLEKIAEELTKLAADKNLTKELKLKQLLELEKLLIEQRDQMANEVDIPIELLAKILPLIIDELKFKQIAARQQDLAERMSALKNVDTTDPKIRRRMKELEEEQTELRRALTELLDEIEDHATQLPEEEQFEQLRQSARQFVDELRASSATEKMRNAERQLAKRNGNGAHKSAQKAADILQSFIKKCEGSGMGLAAQAMNCFKFQPSLSDCLGKSLAQILQMMKMGTGGGGGFGIGSGGGGSSIRSNSLGVYGSLPGMQDAYGRAESGSDDRDHDRTSDGIHTYTNAGDEPRREVVIPALRDPTGIGESVVPPRYRKRVSDYFKRLVDQFE